VSVQVDSSTSWVPGKSIRIADVQGSDYWTAVVGLQVRRPNGQGYRAYLEWRADDGSHYDYTNGEFPLRDGLSPHLRAVARPARPR
jgi:hypothetical protein